MSLTITTVTDPAVASELVDDWVQLARDGDNAIEPVDHLTGSAAVDNTGLAR